MKNSSLLICAIVAIMFKTVVNAASPDDLTVVTVGDSTVADYRLTDVKRGWGQILPEYLKPSVKVVNLALCGRSTKTFFESGHWQKALDAKPAFIFIQFGHNDSHPKDTPEATDANADFMENLRRYVKEAREINATPILVTPPHRITFSKRTGKLTQELKPYADSMKKVAEEMNVPVVDLHSLSAEIFEPLGDNGAEGWTASATDRTHFTEKGARIIAGLVAREAAKIDPRLQAALK